MVFFGIGLKLANNLGLLTALHKKNPFYKCIIGIMLLDFLLVTFHTGYFYWENILDFDKSTAVIGAFMYCIQSIAKSVMFLYKNDDFLVLYFKLKNLCDNPRRLHYQKAQEIEGKIEKYMRPGIVGFYILLLIYAMNPMLQMLIEYVQTGSVIEKRWEFPVPFANPFLNLTSSPGYEIVYAFYGISVIPLVSFLAATDILFMITCYHTYGLLGHLKLRLHAYNENPNRMDFFRSCVEYQNAIYDVVSTTQNVFGGIFFLQFIGTTVILCTQVFLVTQVRRES